MRPHYRVTKGTNFGCWHLFQGLPQIVKEVVHGGWIFLSDPRTIKTSRTNKGADEWSLQIHDTYDSTNGGSRKQS